MEVRIQVAFFHAVSDSVTDANRSVSPDLGNVLVGWLWQSFILFWTYPSKFFGIFVIFSFGREFGACL